MVAGTQEQTYLSESTACIGRGTFASRNYDVGEQIVAFPRPLVGSLEQSRLHDTCANCFMWTEGAGHGARLYVPDNAKVFACTGCKRAQYCGKSCQREAWSRGHKYLCKILKCIPDGALPKAMLACVELMAMKKHGLIEDQDWDMICQLEDHLDYIKKNDSFDQIVPSMIAAVSELPFIRGTFSAEFIAQLYGKVLTNSSTLMTPTFDPLGIVLDIKLALLNHSCDPNAYIVMDGPQVAIRPLKPIKTDEEIYISYIDPTNPYAWRQAELKGHWEFLCRCSKCQKGATLREDAWAIQPKNISQKWRSYAEGHMRDRGPPKDPRYFVGKHREDKMAETLQRKAFNHYEQGQKAEDPEKAIQEIASGMTICKKSRLWPEHRQPYPALRDDFIVNLLSIGDTRMAWAHVAKRHDYLGTLYPQKHHPLRVIQTWQMAMLALSFSCSDDELVSAQRMALISTGLIQEIKDMVILSHGLDNSFTKSVLRQHDDMVAEWLRTKIADSHEDLTRKAKKEMEKLKDMAGWVDGVTSPLDS